MFLLLLFLVLWTIVQWLVDYLKYFGIIGDIFSSLCLKSDEKIEQIESQLAQEAKGQQLLLFLVK